MTETPSSLEWMLVTALVAVCLVYATGAACESILEKTFPPMLLVAEKDNERTIDVRLGERIRINLPENATTGYRWAIDRFDEEFIETIATEPHYTSDAVGSGGEIEFVFQGKKTGSGEIVLKHWRHWEGDSSITQRFLLRCNVQS
ncbi:MAG: protease inhibitor I42 family protein [Gammaproteobacteria bacterium]|jgi:inhibitor of cysteine peptidase|nr:protease inhibitor I42 family protein [Pseudomonadota bacterium]QOJ24003.1 MAG: protease inhibitor I42 family protein [Gammaproteobacteria bacterium]